MNFGMKCNTTNTVQKIDTKSQKYRGCETVERFYDSSICVQKYEL